MFSHCQNVTDHFRCLPNFLLLNAKSKSWSRNDETCPRDRHVKFKNNTSGRERLWDAALKSFCPGAFFIMSPDHLVVTLCANCISYRPVHLYRVHQIDSAILWSMSHYIVISGWTVLVGKSGQKGNKAGWEIVVELSYVQSNQGSRVQD